MQSEIILMQWTKFFNYKVLYKTIPFQDREFIFKYGQKLIFGHTEIEINITI